jgi:hypothetical protein
VKSPEKQSKKVLGTISPERVERLLCDWVNLPLHPANRREMGTRSPQYDRIISRYPEIFVFKAWQTSYRLLLTVREGLRTIWTATDPRQRDWTIYELRNHYRRACAREAHQLLDFISESDVDVLTSLPALTPFEATMFHLQTRLAYRMLFCLNPECAAPYFFRTEKGQKSCSPECGDWLRRQSKLRYYHASPSSPKNREKK